MTTKHKTPLPSWLPFVVGTILVVQFAGLGAWQVSRGFEKRATQQAYEDETGFAEWKNGDEVRSYQRITVRGAFDTERQILLENIVVNGRIGNYVISALRTSVDGPMLLVNRGWLQTTSATINTETLTLPAAEQVLRGRVGSLPKAGIKMGDAVSPGPNWPRTAVYPALEDVEAALGSELQPFILLLEHEQPNGFYRHWVPTEFGPGKHFGYALQWFAMGAVLSGLLVWNFRKRRIT